MILPGDFEMKDYQKRILNQMQDVLINGKKIILRQRCRGKPMKEIDVQEVINMNYRVLTLLGIATSMIIDYKTLEAYHDNSEKCDWFLDAIQKVIYENKPLPQLP